MLTCPVEAQTMKRISERNTPAHQAALKFMRGVNLGNSLEYVANSPAGGLTYTATDYAQIRSEGFDHVRVPVGWHLYCGPAPDFAISGIIFTKVDAVMNGALASSFRQRLSKRSQLSREATQPATINGSSASRVL